MSKRFLTDIEIEQGCGLILTGIDNAVTDPDMFVVANPTTKRLYYRTGTQLLSDLDLVVGGRLLPTGNEGQMLYNNGGVWTATSELFWNDASGGLRISKDYAGQMGMRIENPHTAANGGTKIELSRGAQYRPNQIMFQTGTSTEWYLGQLYDAGGANTAFSLATGSSFSDSKFILTTDGIVAIGTHDIDPWSSSYAALQLGFGGSLFSSKSGTAIYFNSNAYFDGSWRYRNAGTAATYYQSGGGHYFRGVSSGTADAAITWTPLLYMHQTKRTGFGTDNPTFTFEIHPAAGEPNGKLILYCNQLGTEHEIFKVGNTGSGEDDGYLRLYDNGVAKIAMAAVASRGGITYFDTGGNFMVGQTTDAGYKFFVNGTVGLYSTLTIGSISNATTDLDTFLVSDSGMVKYRTGAQVLSDIGAEPAISKSTGYLTWTGSAWAWVNETYSLSTHNHDSAYATVSHTHEGVYEPVLGNPGTSGYILSSTSVGVRSWIAPYSYTHPTKTWVDKTALTGAYVISNLTIDSLGHPTEWTTRQLTYSDVGAAASGHNHTGTYDNYQRWMVAYQLPSGGGGSEWVYSGGAFKVGVTNPLGLAWSGSGTTEDPWKAIISLTETYSLSTHNHDSAYAATSHTHSGVYEPVISKSTGYLKWTGSAWAWIDETYSLSTHHHDSVYAALTHNHDSTYASVSHTHSGVYEPVISKSTGYLKYTGSAWSWVNETYSLSTHNHDSAYAAASHNHFGVYEPVISKSTGYLKYTGSAWSWVNETYSLSTHNHDSAYAAASHSHQVATGGTGLTSLTAGRIPYGAGTSAFGNSANLFWDSANGFFGVGINGSPLATGHFQNSGTGEVIRISTTGQITGSGYQGPTLQLTSYNEVPFGPYRAGYLQGVWMGAGNKFDLYIGGAYNGNNVTGVRARWDGSVAISGDLLPNSGLQFSTGARINRIAGSTDTPSWTSDSEVSTNKAIANKIASDMVAWGGAAQLYSKKVQLTSAQLLSLADTPVKLIDAPGSTKMIFVVSVVGILDFLSSEYTTGINRKLQVYTHTADAVIYESNANFYTKNSDCAQPFVFVDPSGTDRIYLDNEEIYIKATSNFANGNSPINIHITYLIW